MIAIAAVVVIAVIVGACSNPTNSDADEQETYTVSFDRQDGSGGSTSVTVTLGQPMPTALAPTKAGAVFDGYYIQHYSASDGTGAQYYTAAMESARDWDVSTDVELVAHWAFQIGETGPAGGIVFYDKGAYSDGWRYLEAAPASTEWVSKPWGGFGTAVGTAAQGTAIGTGEANTQEIVAAYGDTEQYADRTDYAAKLAADLDHGGYDDWFLPSKGELDEMYVNLHEDGSGGFASAYYWGSSEGNAYNAWRQYFGSGSQGGNGKYNGYRVRAARAF